MTFSEIKQFTRSSSWCCSYSLEQLVRCIKDWVENDGLQLNPDFQRGHVWTEEQQIAFIEFFLRGGQSGLELYFNQPGWMSDFSGDFVCVDGLQRITAIQKFIKNEIKAFGQYYSEFGGKTSILGHTMNVHVNNLKTKNEVLTWYIEMNSGGTVHSDEEIERVKGMISD